MSASPRVPTSEKARSRWSSPKSSQAAMNSRLCSSRSASGSLRQAGGREMILIGNERVDPGQKEGIAGRAEGGYQPFRRDLHLGNI